MKLIGLIVNPIAGMGGAVGLKGTDGEMYKKALELGAHPVTPIRTQDLLALITQKEKIHFLVAPHKMGEEYLAGLGLSYTLIGNVDGDKTTREDTKSICKLIADAGVELIVFVGGDGTARDIFDVIGLSIPVVAVPAGVKIFSGIFAVNPKSAAALIDAFVNGVDLYEEEVLDIDEKAYRENRLDVQLYGYLRVPKIDDFIQHSKAASSQSGSELDDKVSVAEWMQEKLSEGILYLLGPGTTVKALTDMLQLPKTLLGIDGLYNNAMIASDLNEQQILKILDDYPKRKIIVTPIGGNGFIFGRGNKQFTPEVLRKIGIKNIIILSTKEKIAKLGYLRVDTGDALMDRDLRGYQEVIVGYHESRMMKVV